MESKFLCKVKPQRRKISFVNKLRDAYLKVEFTIYKKTSAHLNIFGFTIIFIGMRRARPHVGLEAADISRLPG
jgi:hypothetical protein